ncbi:hypothetical protein LTR70_008170 [Exophiala xenobiotica]|uniref:Heterokaryon incompatibility domain-containing protein n=1 Tax=Lithohypha guttulata TaxID=1690604 RepID=A0ABR0K316_9EURO|nr:hypothetical protein LTR24_007757 [Lithohypha guttulata]KAK5312489.1 hypothetical protein LTR70_008170 [Exophiala xenobiotica]
MYLLNTQTLKLKHFNSEYDVRYCTLSHRWLPGDEELLFQEVDDISASYKQGAVKIRSACSIALDNGYDYIWIDTCCIDKTSSAALSEVINSMYRYYELGKVCLAYIADARLGDEKSFVRSEWFNRSWTLQELLAPPEVVFYDMQWEPMGTRTSLNLQISTATGIDQSALDGGAPERFSVAERMSWAAERNASRVEDIAYSLMGLFDVNMPMLYGEGAKAFIRLQEEIIKGSNDQTLVAWSGGPDATPSGLLASSPQDFRLSRRMRPSSLGAIPSSILLTPKGIELDVSKIPVEDYEYNGISMALLEVVLAVDCGGDSCVGFFLAQEKGSSGVFRRVTYEGRHLFAESYQWWNTRIAARSHVCVCPSQPASSLKTHAYVQIDSPKIAIHLLGNYVPRIHWHEHCGTSDAQSSKRHLNLSDRSSNPVCTLDLTEWEAGVQFIHFGFDNTHRPVCLITDASYVYNGETDQLKKLLENKGLPPARERVPDFRRLFELAQKVGYGLPTLSTLRNAEIDYLCNFPWSQFDGRTLIPHAAHLGCWAVIGNAGQDLHFTVDSKTVRNEHVYELLVIGSVPSMDYTATVAFGQRRHGSTSAWYMDIELFDKPLNTLRHDIRHGLQHDLSLFTLDSRQQKRTGSAQFDNGSRLTQATAKKHWYHRNHN